MTLNQAPLTESDSSNCSLSAEDWAGRTNQQGRTNGERKKGSRKHEKKRKEKKWGERNEVKEEKKE